ncbi:MAG: RNA degradosome polyphosphate kinase [Candidatus Ancillula sp.]|jgi:polyphosphate kinase|nr:RNA degradosome polyphosphate kinase [Candidatus Ancillula sp.]
MVTAKKNNINSVSEKVVVHKKPSLIAQDNIAEHIADVEYKHIKAQVGSDRFQERELSWLQFNQRVFEMEQDPNIPLLERVNFSAIFASNLDEFFMVRVAGLKRRIKMGLAVVGAAGLQPKDVFFTILERANKMQIDHANYFCKELAPALEKEGIKFWKWNNLSTDQQQYLTNIFTRDIYPILTPLAIDPAHPFPYISGGSLSLAVIVKNPKTGQEHYARVKIPSNLPRFIVVDGGDDHSSLGYITLEDLIQENLEMLFPGMEIKEASAFRVTRNEDLEVEEDDAENLLKAMEKELLRRKFGPPIRLEVVEEMSSDVRNWLISELGVDKQEVFILTGPLDHTGLFQISSLDRPDLRYPKFMPKTHRYISKEQSSDEIDIFAAVSRGDILLHHPYDSFSTSVQRFLEQAASDPNVLAIKQTLYRTSGDSPIVQALIDAAQNGKQVLALIEIKARFDEERNIEWARKLEKAGVHVVYGIVGLKTHCKLSLVIRREGDQIVHYSHVGTGNYNPKTARLYTDHGLLTKSQDVGDDLSKLFNQLSGYAPKSRYERLLVAPRSIRKGILERIYNETEAAKRGEDSWIKIKVNSIVDEECIEALYRASEAGVKVDMIVRGICAVKAGVKPFSENLRVRSILGRFLEHSRIYAFAHPLLNDKQLVEDKFIEDKINHETPAQKKNDPNLVGPEVWIGSADLMHRNLDRRVETLIKIVEPDQIGELVNLLEFTMSEKVSAFDLMPDGNYVRNFLDKEGHPLVDIQAQIIKAMKNKSRAIKLK